MSTKTKPRSISESASCMKNAKLVFNRLAYSPSWTDRECASNNKHVTACEYNVCTWTCLLHISIATEPTNVSRSSMNLFEKRSLRCALSFPVVLRCWAMALICTSKRKRSVYVRWVTEIWVHGPWSHQKQSQRLKNIFFWQLHISSPPKGKNFA